MDSGNSGSMQSSSGGETQDHEISRPDSIPVYLNSPTGHLFASSDPTVHPSLLSQYQNHPPTTTTLFDHHLSSSNYTYDHFHTTLSHPQPNSSNPNFIPSPRSNQPNSTNPIPNPQPSSTTTEARGGQTNTVATRNTKKRTRASRRAPTTVLTTDTSNFRAMVQEFTGIPAPPFSASSSSPYARRLEMFGSGIRSPLYPLRPSAQKVHQPAPFLSPSSNSNSSLLMMMSNSISTMVDATNIATTSNNSNVNFSSTNYQLLSDHHQNQGLFQSMQNPILTFQSLPQQPPPFHSSINVPNFGARPTPRGVIDNLAMHSSLEDQLGPNRHGSSPYVNTNQLGGDGVGSIDDSHVAASDGNGGWRDHGVLGSRDGRLSSHDHHLRPSLDKCLEMGNVNSTTRGESAVDSWISPNSDH
ncbi:flocculation protein FLO11-like [Pyrus ussuriensis x Pyrus communis]|uniref:Flocculation protein FLO11-like n=1 Tax=Pyrus ussuriensis x Pyrus communis TaxID=2448454 RepID=A0A5N5HS41_9ROSA|nr:flocculation protein FLO11-like [Pyrus ussuriensis x Pyrus communis]